LLAEVVLRAEEVPKGIGAVLRKGACRDKTERCAVATKRPKRNDALSVKTKRCAVGSHLLKQNPTKDSIARKRKAAALDLDFLAEIMAGAAKLQKI